MVNFLYVRKKLEKSGKETVNDQQHSDAWRTGGSSKNLVFCSRWVNCDFFFLKKNMIM